MDQAKKLFKKAGGFSLLLQYLRAGVLPIAIIQFLLLGNSKKALEILRHTIQYKIYNKLKKKYKYVFDKQKTLNYNSLPQENSNKIWICWLQGIENAPLLVQKCYESIKEHLGDKEIILITSENLFQYAQFPEYIIAKWKKGIISNTLFSDILRTELLIRHGGTWIDSTVLCTGSNIPDYIFNSDLFLYQILKPGRDGHSIFISSWFISAKTNNKILLTTRDLMYEYWKKKNYTIDYFLFHIFICISLEYFPEEWNKIPKLSSSIPHILLLQLFEPFNKKKYEAIKELTCFHKLSYKFDDSLKKKDNTYYNYIINKGSI